VFAALKSAPSSGEYPHVARWYEHIASWEKEHATLPGDKEAASKLFGGASASAAPATGAPAAEEDDEIDLFGSDEVCGLRRDLFDYSSSGAKHFFFKFT
jgi:elongation factor 1-beta